MTSTQQSNSTPPRRLVGRERELALLDQLLQDASSGHPRVACVEGPAGVGKTALLNGFRERLKGVQELYASGEALEGVLQFGVIDQLSRHIRNSGRAVGRLIDGRIALEPDPFMVGLDLLEAIGELEDSEPVLLAIDDAHWADPASLQAVAFAFRRLRADRVMLLLSSREDRFADLPEALQRLILGDAGTRIDLAGLDVGEVGLLAEHAGWRLSRLAIERLHAHTGGNPLHVNALLEEIEPATLNHEVSHLPAPRSFREIVRARLQQCSPAVNNLVEAASVLGRRCTLDQLTRMQTLADPLATLDEASAAGLIEYKGDLPHIDIEFQHPLVAAAIYHRIQLERRSTLHRRAAAVVEDELVSLRHELSAHYGPSLQLAEKFDAYARRQMARSSWNPAAVALRSAAVLTEERSEKERRMLDAIDCELLAGLPSSTVDLSAYKVSAQRTYIMARMKQVAGRPFEAEPLFKMAWDASASARAPGDDLPVRIATWYALVLLNDGRSGQAVEWCHRALEAMEPTRTRSTVAQNFLLISLASQGKASEALKMVADLPDDPSMVSVNDFELLLGRGIARLWSDRLWDARKDLVRAVELARERTSTPLMLSALGRLSESEYRLGDWDNAILHGELAVSAALDSDRVAALAHVIAAFPHIGRGAWEQATRHIEEAHRIARHVGDLTSTGYTAVARAQLALTQRRWDDAAAALGLLIEDTREPANEPGVMAWQLMYVEALLHQGRLDDGKYWLDRAEARIRERCIASQLPVVALLRGDVEARAGNLPTALGVFETSAATELKGAGPMELARFELAYGSLLRRVGRRRTAKAQLESARHRLEVMGAQPLLARCEAELTGAGMRPVHRTTDHRNLLTSQELAVARLVADGMTNRQVAGQLFISPRTVDYHLVHVYGKIGVSSRSQLVRQFSELAGHVPASRESLA